MANLSSSAFCSLLTSRSVSAHIKYLNGSKGRGAYFLRVKQDREYNEIILTLTDGHAVRASYHIDLGHTKADKLAALEDLHATADRMLAL